MGCAESREGDTPKGDDNRKKKKGKGKGGASGKKKKGTKKMKTSGLDLPPPLALENDEPAEPKEAEKTDAVSLDQPESPTKTRTYDGSGGFFKPSTPVTGIAPKLPEESPEKAKYSSSTATANTSDRDLAREGSHVRSRDSYAPNPLRVPTAPFQKTAPKPFDDGTPGAEVDGSEISTSDNESKSKKVRTSDKKMVKRKKDPKTYRIMTKKEIRQVAQAVDAAAAKASKAEHTMSATKLLFVQRWIDSADNTKLLNPQDVKGHRKKEQDKLLKASSKQPHSSFRAFHEPGDGDASIAELAVEAEEGSDPGDEAKEEGEAPTQEEIAKLMAMRRMRSNTLFDFDVVSSKNGSVRQSCDGSLAVEEGQDDAQSLVASEMPKASGSPQKPRLF